MEKMINKDLIKKLRNNRSWSQDQLAAVSGLSLRTVQRIENEGSCSLESKKALAAVFAISASSLDVDPTAAEVLALQQRGRNYGLAGAGVGLVCAYIGITVAFVSGDITASLAGLYYGGSAAFCGFCCAAIGVFANRREQKDVAI